jgi:hypothetical protein
MAYINNENRSRAMFSFDDMLYIKVKQKMKWKLRMKDAKKVPCFPLVNNQPIYSSSILVL